MQLHKKTRFFVNQPSTVYREGDDSGESTAESSSGDIKKRTNNGKKLIRQKID